MAASSQMRIERSKKRNSKFEREPTMIWRLPRSFFEVPANCQPWHRQRADLNAADLNIKVGIRVSSQCINRGGFKSCERFSDTNKLTMFDRTRVKVADHTNKLSHFEFYF